MKPGPDRFVDCTIPPFSLEGQLRTDGGGGEPTIIEEREVCACHELVHAWDLKQVLVLEIDVAHAHAPHPRTLLAHHFRGLLHQLDVKRGAVTVRSGLQHDATDAATEGEQDVDGTCQGERRETTGGTSSP